MVAEPRSPTPISLVRPSEAATLLRRIEDNIGLAIRGSPRTVRMVLVGLCCRGHILLEGAPGVGKTSLAQALARSLDLSFSRIQFTSDSLPADILGLSVFDPQKMTFEFRRGPIFAHIVLADELNWAPPRVQSALLEAMAERQVSIDGVRQRLPEPFLVVATQNPLEHAGTFALPDAQLDRFALRLTLSYPDASSESAILMARGLTEPWRDLGPVAGPAEVEALQASASAVRIDPALASYVVALANRTREPGFARSGISTRGALELVNAAKAHALIEGRNHLLPDDIKAVAVAALSHRLSPRGSSGVDFDRSESEALVARALAEVPIPL